MFTGIIENQATLEKLTREGSNLRMDFSCALAHELKVDQSLSHNGVCLTVEKVSPPHYTVTAIEETLLRSNLGELKTGDRVNIERCMPANGRFDGHVVQGHVDTTGICRSAVNKNGSWEFEFAYEEAAGRLTVEKGSVTVNGVSLTVVKSEPGLFSVHIIPYTFEHTNFRQIKSGSRVNLEFDIIGKYVARLLTMPR